MGQLICSMAQELNCQVILHGCREGWSIEGRPEVIVDVSHRAAFSDVFKHCQSEGISLVEGTSGFLPEDQAGLHKLSEIVPVVHAPNFAFGHFLQTVLVACLAKSVEGSLDLCECTVLDRHPTYKLDRPSATAKELAKLWLEYTGVEVTDISTVRAGLPVSDHEITLTLPGELVSVRHSVTTRTAAAHGAIRAARWARNQPTGLWKMSDVYTSNSI